MFQKQIQNSLRNGTPISRKKDSPSKILTKNEFFNKLFSSNFYDSLMLRCLKSELQFDDISKLMNYIFV